MLEGALSFTGGNWRGGETAFRCRPPHRRPVVKPPLSGFNSPPLFCSSAGLGGRQSRLDSFEAAVTSQNRPRRNLTFSPETGAIPLARVCVKNSLSRQPNLRMGGRGHQLPCVLTSLLPFCGSFGTARRCHWHAGPGAANQRESKSLGNLCPLASDRCVKTSLFRHT